MGNWAITIVGTGCHHNANRSDEWRDENDADEQFRNFVAELKKSGHTIHFATFVHGGGETADGTYVGQPPAITEAEVIRAIRTNPQMVEKCLITNPLGEALKEHSKPVEMTPL